MGVNITNRSSRVLIYLAGGGGCWDATTCADSFHVRNANLHGFGAEQFQRLMVTGAPEYSPPITASFGSRGIWDRDDHRNPFRDWSYVYIPYCTGDFHEGASPESPITGLYHVGYVNVGNALSAVRDMIPNPTQIVLSGSSAGGYGASWNYLRAVALFAPIQVTLLDESGPALGFATKDGAPLLPKALQDDWNRAWNLDDTKPAEAPTRYVLDVFLTNLAAMPQQKSGLIASKLDPVFPLFFATSGGAKDVWTWSRGLTELRSSLAQIPQATMYYLPLGTEHDYLHKPVSQWPIEMTNQPWALRDWLNQLMETP